MGVQNPNSTSYVHPDEPNLLNLHKAMEYADDGKPHIRVTLGTDTITITGNVNLVDQVTVNNTEEQAIPVYIVGNSISVTQGTDPWKVTGNVNANVSGNVGVTGNVNANITGGNVNAAVTGSVTVTTMPAITGNVNANVTNMPAITGNVNANVSGTVELGANSLAALESITVTQGTDPWRVSGNVNANVSGNINANITGGNVNANVSGNVNANVTGSVTANVTTLGNVVITGNTLPVSGNVGVSGNVNANITGGNVNANVTQGTSPWVVSGNVNANITGGNINANISNGIVSYGDTIQMDSTDRLRVSIIGQQWWYVPAIDKDGDLRIIEAFQGNATSTFIQNLASVRLTSGQTYNANAKLTGSAIRASRRRHKTRPGVGGEWIGIINWDGLQTNVVKRVGMFTNFNGVFFEANNDTINCVVRRRLTDGTLVETRIPHTEWNGDPMDGTGPSGYNWFAPTVTANITSVYSKATVAIPGAGSNVYQVTYQMPSGQETIIPVGQKVTVTGLTPATFNDTGLITSIDQVNHRVTIAYIVDPGVYVSASNARLNHTPFHHIHSYWFDFNGSRTARIRFGLHTDAGKVVVHNYVGGELGTQWASAPALMDRKEIVNVGQPVGYLPSLTVAGSAVTIETSSDINPGFGMASSPTPITFNKNSQVGSEFAIIGVGIRDGEPYQRADIQVNQFQIVDLGNLNPQNAGIFQWRLVLNPTPSVAPTTADVGKTTHQFIYSAGTTLSGGITLMSGYAQGTFTGDVKTALNFLNMGSNIDYTDSDKVVLAVKLLVGGTDNSSVVGIINYTEDL